MAKICDASSQIPLLTSGASAQSRAGRPDSALPRWRRAGNKLERSSASPVGYAHAQGLDPASAEALSATLRMLADPVSRGEAILGTPGAAEVDRQVQGIAGSTQLAQEMYGIAAAVFADLARSSGGDAARMSAALERAKSDPAGFAARLSPETLQRLRELSTKISDAKR